jgi:hypothetical protein
MRAILIDSETQTLTEIQMIDDSYENLVAIIHANRPEWAFLEDESETRVWIGPELNNDGTGHDSLYVDSDPHPPYDPGYFLDGANDRDHYISGRAIAMRCSHWRGVEEGYVLLDLQISLDALTKRITFAPRRPLGEV